MTGSQAVHAPLNRESCGDGNFTYVAIDDQGHPQVIKRDEPPISI
jgi:acyl-CoA hydrolase